MPTSVFIIEDEPDIAEILRYNLEREGFAVEVEARGDRAFDAVLRARPDLLVLDLMLPGLDGLELARLFKRHPETASIPIVMLTARSGDVDRIVGLELGADDYVTKPFSPREVLLRIKAVLRRTRDRSDAPAVLEAGGLRLDADAHRTWVRGEEVRLTATEFRLLRHLLERRGRVQTREQLLSDVWGYASDVDSRTVDTHVRRLRRKLGPEGRRIATLIGVGYRLED